MLTLFEVSFKLLWKLLNGQKLFALLRGLELFLGHISYIFKSDFSKAYG